MRIRGAGKKPQNELTLEELLQGRHSGGWIFRSDRTPASSLPVEQLPEVQSRQRAALAELRRQEFGRRPLLRKLGRFALDAVAGATLLVSNPQLFVRSEAQNEESLATGKGINILGRVAANRVERSQRRRRQYRSKQAGAVVDVARKYRAENAATIDAVETLMHNEQVRRGILNTVRQGSTDIVTHLSEGSRHQSAYSFAKAIPRRPKHEGATGFTGNYADLAKNTLASARRYQSRGEDGTIPLLGANLAASRIIESERQAMPLNAVREAEAAYVDGVATALWQLGFVKFDDEKNISRGRGEFNPDITWETTPDRVVARLPYDQTNELHQLLAGGSNNDNTNPMLELEMPREPNKQVQDPYLNLRMVQTPVAAWAVAA